MLLNYLRLSLRLLARNPFSTFINIAGLSIGFAIFFVLWQYSERELKSDQFVKDYDRIYKIGSFAQWTDDNVNYQGSICGASHYGITDVVAKHTVVSDRTDFFSQRYFSETFTHGHGSKIFMSYIDEKENRVSFLEDKVIYAEPNFFQFFSLPLLQGNPQSILARPDAVVISEATAQKYFGSDNPVGKTLHLNNTIPLQVMGVFQNLPRNTHFSFDIVISTERIRTALTQLKGGELFYSFSFCKLQAGIDIDELKNRINAKSGNEVTRSVWGNWHMGKAEILFQPLKEVAFEALRFDTHTSKSKYLLYVFSIASVVILSMAWVNHVNLALASAGKRLKELGARKAVGAKSADFITQFMVEVILINLFCILFAFTWVQLARVPAELFLQFHIPDWTSISLSTWTIFGAVLIIGIVLTGTHLALTCLKRTPKSLFLAHQARNSNNTNWMLSIFQFSGTCVLVIWIFTVHRQVSFILTRDIGLTRDHVLVVDLPFLPTDNFRSDIDQLTSKASSLPSIIGYTVSSNVTADYWEGRMGLSLKEGTGSQVESNGGVDENFIPFFGVKLLAGRNFQSDRPADKKAILISRGAALRLGLKNPEDAIGQKLLNPPDCEIIGVFEDYNLRPLIKNDEITYNGLPGIGLSYRDHLLPQLVPRKISFRVTSEKFEETIIALEKIYRGLFLQGVFNWYFLDDQINSQYQSDKMARNQILFFSMVAIGIACLGLLGFISNNVVEKTKEIGIRKVLGAQLHEIAQILLTPTVKQIAAAAIIGIPVSYYLTHQYLERFSEHIELKWWYFVLPVVILVAIMLLTIASVLWKAAKSNPVEALKYE